MSVYLKLNKAREAFHQMELKKSGENKFAGYKYFELGDFLKPAMKAFADAGLCGVISFEHTMATMTVVDVEKPENYLKITSPMGSAALKGVHEVQNIGAVETYQRRYLWMAALEIVEHDAIDSTEPVKEAPKPAKPAKPGEMKDPDFNETAALQAINACGNLSSLKAVFGSYWTAAPEASKPVLKSTYDARKALIEAE